MLKFLKKGVKKIFKGAKKLIKKIPTGVWIAAATFFTAGLATAGWGAFTGVSSLGGFMGAVGRTTVIGAQGLMGSVGIGQGVSANMAGGIEGLSAGATLFGGNTGAFAGSSMNIPLLGSGTASVPTGNTIQQSRTLGNLFGGLKSGTGTGTGTGQTSERGQLLRQSMILSAVQSGAQAYLAHSAEKRADKRTARLNFFGAPARGSGVSELPFDIPDFSEGVVTTANISEQPFSTDFVSKPTEDLFDELNENFTPSFMRGIV